MRAVGAVLLASVAVGAGGCNAILGLDPTHRSDGGTAIDASDDGGNSIDAGCAIGHDEDGDGLDDGCDLCPQIAGDPQTDSDGDGIGDACDPNPADPDDVLVFFDSFAVPSPWTGVRGTWNRQDDAFAQLDLAAGSALASRTIPDPTAVDLTVDVVFTIDAWLPEQTMEVVADRGVGVWFVASGFTAANDPSGYLCQLVEDIASTSPSSDFGMYGVGTNSIVVLSQQVFAAATPQGVSGRMRARRSSSIDHEQCHLALPPLAGDLTGADTTYTTGTIGVRTLDTAVHVTSVTVYGRKN